MGLNIIQERDVRELILKWAADNGITDFGFSVSKQGGSNMQYSETAGPELEQQVAELEDEVEELEGNIDSLEDEIRDLENDNDELLGKIAKLEKLTKTDDLE